MIDRTLTPNAIRFVRARWYTAVSPGRHIQYVVLHSMEAPEKGTTAESVAEYFRTTDRKASAHYCIDSDSIVQSVQTKDVAWAAPYANRNGVHLEHAGYARQSRADWLDGYSTQMLKNSAYLSGLILCPKFAIPARFVNADGLRLGQRDTSVKGFTTHAEVSRAFNPSGHTDPGPEFPLDQYLAWVREVLSGKSI